MRALLWDLTKIGIEAQEANFLYPVKKCGDANVRDELRGGE